MKICLVTAFPPSRGGLSEYGFHIAQELRQNSFLSLSVLADDLGDISLTEEGGFSVIRCWSFNDPRSAKRLLSVIRQLDPDVVWFNLLFTTFGHQPLAAFSGLSTPLFTRLNGYYTHVTLHHLMDTVDLKDAGVRFPRVYKAAGALATWMLLMSNSLTVLMPNYRKILMENYGRGIVRVRAHGILSRPEYPDFSRRGNPVHRILAFGKWGTYKRLEPMIAAFELLAKSRSDVKLTVAGGDHPRTPGYVASVAKRYENDRRLEFTGYVPEERVPDLFRNASVVVMPYSSSTGSSGVAHVASAFGVPIICADIPDFRQMAEEEGLAIDFYELGDQENLAQRLAALLGSPEQQAEMAVQNFTAALRMTMPSIVHDYLRHFDVAKRARVLKKNRWLRRLPRWLPSRSLLGRAVSRNRAGWQERPSLTYKPLDAAGPALSQEGCPRDGKHDGRAHNGVLSINGSPGLAEPLAEELVSPSPTAAIPSDCAYTMVRSEPKPEQD